MMHGVQQPGAFWADRRVLVTGGFGFVGRWMIRALIDRGATVAVADPSNLEEFSGVVVHHSRPIDSVPEAMAALDAFEPAVVVHLAGQAGVSACERDPCEAFESNVRCTMHLLEALRQRPCGVRALVATSSNHVYGELEPGEVVEEDDALGGLGPYAATKACADILCRSYARSYGLPITVARITNSFGGDDPHVSHIVTSAILSCLRGDRPVIKRSGRDTKAFMHVGDTVSGLLHLCEQTAERPGVRGEAFNIVPDEPTSVRDLVVLIMRLCGQGGEPEILAPGDPAEQEHLSAEKTARMLGWRATRSLEAGLAETIAWYRAHDDHLIAHAG